jgi:hypothetical protein
MTGDWAAGLDAIAAAVNTLASLQGASNPLTSAWGWGAGLVVSPKLGS